MKAYLGHCWLWPVSHDNHNTFFPTFSHLFFFSLIQAPDKAPSQASWWRSGRRERDQGTSVLPLDWLGPSGETGDSAALQTQNCQLNRWTTDSIDFVFFLSISLFLLSLIFSFSLANLLSSPPLFLSLSPCLSKGTFRELKLSLCSICYLTLKLPRYPSFPCMHPSLNHPHCVAISSPLPFSVQMASRLSLSRPHSHLFSPIPSLPLVPTDGLWVLRNRQSSHNRRDPLTLGSCLLLPYANVCHH